MPYYVKIVAERFSEVHKSKKQKTINAEALASRQKVRDFVSTVVTPQRIEKMLYKFIDDGMLNSDWDEHDMKFLAANLPKAIFEDCRKEESETVAQVKNFGKICAQITME